MRNIVVVATIVAVLASVAVLALAVAGGCEEAPPNVPAAPDHGPGMHAGHGPGPGMGGPGAWGGARQGAGAWGAQRGTGQRGPGQWLRRGYLKTIPESHELWSQLGTLNNQMHDAQWVLFELLNADPRDPEAIRAQFGEMREIGQQLQSVQQELRPYWIRPQRPEGGGQGWGRQGGQGGGGWGEARGQGRGGNAGMPPPQGE